MGQRIIHIILLTGAILFGAGVLLFFMNHSVYAQTTYFGPNSPQPGLVRVDVQIYDDPDLGGVRVEDITFNGQLIPLKPPGIHGRRGGGSFQLAPGNYKLVWNVSRSTNDWPRTIRHQEKIQVGAQDVWLQVEIHGEKVGIS